MRFAISSIKMVKKSGNSSKSSASLSALEQEAYEKFPSPSKGSETLPEVKKLTKKQQQLLEKQRAGEDAGKSKKEFSEQLIAAVQSRPFIYDKRDPNHSRKQRVARAWTEISEEIGYDESACHTRWRSLKDTFLKKFQEYAHGGVSGDGCDEASKPSWPWFESMMFLKDCETKQRTVDSLVEEGEEDDVGSPLDSPSSQLPRAGTKSPVIIKKGNKRTAENCSEVIIEKLSKFIDTQDEKEEEPTKASSFLQYVACELTKFHEDDVEEFIDECTDILRKIKRQRRMLVAGVIEFHSVL